MSAHAIDLTTALPPAPPELDRGLQSALAALASGANLGALIRHNRPGGHAADREVGASWVGRRLGPDLDSARVIVTNGTQSALLLMLQHYVGAGGLIAAEALTYVVLQTLAARLGIEIAGVALDEHGLVPAAYERLCRERRPRALYCNPTIQNPTTSVMPPARRAEIAAISRQYNVLIIEDDVLGAVHPEAPAPLAMFAPERTWHVTSLSKCFAMGLRMAYLVAPSATAATELVDPVRRLSWWFPSSLSAEIVARWVADGTGRQIAAAIRAEADARQAIAADQLATTLPAGAQMATAPGALHLWLSLPAMWSRQEFTAAAAKQGVLVRPANLFAVDATPAPESIRISLTGPRTRDELRAGLAIVAQLLEP